MTIIFLNYNLENVYMGELKKTPLYEEHIKLGAKVVGFGGYLMPVQYTNIIEEHVNTRTNAGLFDISHMGEFEISGKDSFRFIQWLVTNDISKLEVGKGLYTPMCYENGTIVDDLFVYMLAPEKFLLVVNAANSDKDFSWVRKVSEGFEVEFKDVSNDTAELALQGPKAEKILQKVTDVDLANLNYFRFVYSNLNGTRALISRTGYTGEDGFELYIDPDEVVHVWNKLLEVGEEDGLKPVGLGARNTLRLEACLRLYGNDIDDTTTPLEAGMGWTVKFDKGDFIGKGELLKQKGNLKRRIVAFEMVDKAIARHSYPISKENADIGHVTSGTFSPILKKPIGMAYVNVEHVREGEEIEILIRNKHYKAQIVSKSSFIEKKYKK